MTLNDIHQLAREGFLMYAVNKDPLTFSAAEICIRVTSLPFNEAQQNAALVLKKQLDAYITLFPEPFEPPHNPR